MHQWLENFVPKPDHFDWDAGNTTKSLKHGVSKVDIESIFSQDAIVFAGKITEPAHP